MEGMTKEQRHGEFISFLADGNYFPGTELKVRIIDAEFRSIEIALESKMFANVTNALDLILDKANSLKATINTSDRDFWLTLESPEGNQNIVLDIFTKHGISFDEETVLKIDGRGKSKVIFSIRFC